MVTNEQPLLTPGEPAPGTEVELITGLVASDANRLRAYQVLGARPAGSVNGVDYLDVVPGEKARVVQQEGDAVRVQIRGGRWRGREGWVARDALRASSAETILSTERSEGLSLTTRLEIFYAIQEIGMKASALANSQFPFDRIPTDSEGAKRYLAEKEALYNSTKDRGRCGIMERYQIAEGRLDRIEAEARDERWPPWDGLADDRGPIPTFGPIRTDEHGRIVINDAEEVARRDAIIRALQAVGNITDETDTDEIWDQVFRRLREGR